jgi:cytochrome P450
MFCKEALRLNPPSPIVWRRAARDFRFAGRRIPAGTMTGANLMLSHRIESLWPDPLAFDPMRFTPEAEKARHRFAYAPFGAGIHKCLGMHFSQQQARTLLTHVLLNAELRLERERPPRWYHWPSCRPRGRIGVWVDPRCPGR